jgi:hypothetical protein
MEERRGEFRVIVVKLREGKPRRRWEDNIKMNLEEVGWGNMRWTELARDRDRWWELVNALTNLRVP